MTTTARALRHPRCPRFRPAVCNRRVDVLQPRSPARGSECDVVVAKFGVETLRSKKKELARRWSGWAMGIIDVGGPGWGIVCALNFLRHIPGLGLFWYCLCCRRSAEPSSHCSELRVSRARRTMYVLRARSIIYVLRARRTIYVHQCKAGRIPAEATWCLCKWCGLFFVVDWWGGKSIKPSTTAVAFYRSALSLPYVCTGSSALTVNIL